MIVFVTTGTDPLGLDRKFVTWRYGYWCWLDSVRGLWCKLDSEPEVDLDYTQRWFGYREETMKVARAILAAHLSTASCSPR